jgi:hypothetical protein
VFDVYCRCEGDAADDIACVRTTYDLESERCDVSGVSIC